MVIKIRGTDQIAYRVLSNHDGTFRVFWSTSWMTGGEVNLWGDYMPEDLVVTDSAGRRHRLTETLADKLARGHVGS